MGSELLVRGRRRAHASGEHFRPIHYLGSKLRLIPEICGLVDQLNPGKARVCDLFSGSGTVSYALGQAQEVVAVDIQEYSRVLCSAVLQPASPTSEDAEAILREAKQGEFFERACRYLQPLLDHEGSCLMLAASGDARSLCELIDSASIAGLEQGVAPPSGTLGTILIEVKNRLSRNRFGELRLPITRYYGGVYFSFEQALALDSILEAIESYPSQRDTLLAAVLTTASEMVNTVGKQFAQPIRASTSSGTPKFHLIQKILRDRGTDAFALYAQSLGRYRRLRPAERAHEAVQSDYVEFLSHYQGDLGLIYADPPYTRDHYSRYYHVLETICLRDNPRLSTNTTGGRARVSRGIYREGRHQSPFCIKRQAPEAFAALFSGARAFGVPLVLSYSPYDPGKGARPRMMTIDGIRAIATHYYSRIEIAAAGGITHNKFNTSARNVPASSDAEVLFVCEP